jgi:NitT/TauT family transport system substrate-binding protein
MISDAAHTPAALATTSAGLIQVPVAIGADVSLAYLPYEVARSFKYFEADGLAVNLRYTPGTTQAGAALMSGSVMFSADSLEDAIGAQPQGKALKMIVSFTRCPGVAVLVRSDLSDAIRSPADFKGKKIGVTSIGAGTHLLAAALAARAGFKLEDYTVAAVGSSTMAAAFARQAIDVGFVSDPFATQLLKSGKVVIMADLRTQADSEKYLGGEFPLVGMLAAADTLQERPDIVQKMVNALVRAQAYIRAHTARELADALPDDVTGRDKQAWTDAYSASAGMYSSDGRATQTGVENVVAAYRLFGAIKPDDKIDAAALYDTFFVDRVK